MFTPRKRDREKGNCSVSGWFDSRAQTGAHKIGWIFLDSFTKFQVRTQLKQSMTSYGNLYAFSLMFAEDVACLHFQALATVCVLNILYDAAHWSKW